MTNVVIMYGGLVGERNTHTLIRSHASAEFDRWHRWQAIKLIHEEETNKSITFLHFCKIFNMERHPIKSFTENQHIENNTCYGHVSILQPTKLSGLQSVLAMPALSQMQRTDKRRKNTSETPSPVVNIRVNHKQRKTRSPEQKQGWKKEGKHFPHT